MIRFGAYKVMRRGAARSNLRGAPAVKRAGRGVVYLPRADARHDGAPAASAGRTARGSPPVGLQLPPKCKSAVSWSLLFPFFGQEYFQIRRLLKRILCIQGVPTLDFAAAACPMLV